MTELTKLDLIVNSVVIDFYLWDFAKEKLEGLTEFAMS